jgi:hypothetical protein
MLVDLTLTMKAMSLHAKASIRRAKTDAKWRSRMWLNLGHP